MNIGTYENSPTSRINNEIISILDDVDGDHLASITNTRKVNFSLASCTKKVLKEKRSVLGAYMKMALSQLSLFIKPR